MKIATFLFLLCAFLQVFSQQSKLLDTAEGEVLPFAEQMPEFPGGDDALMSFLQKNVKYPLYALENDLQGTVMASFVICEDGSICQLKISKSPDSSFNPIVLDVLSKMPNWKPASHQGKAVKVFFDVPINFTLHDNNEKTKELTLSDLKKEIEKFRKQKLAFTYSLKGGNNIQVIDIEDYEKLTIKLESLKVKEQLNIHNILDKNKRKSKTTYRYIIKE
jgi:TonB family protein